jgi:hypothetical protein
MYVFFVLKEIDIKDPPRPKHVIGPQCMGMVLSIEVEYNNILKWVFDYKV